MDKYVCNPCGWIYDPAIGDPENGIEAGTAFENLPDDWACPLCGAGKEEFEKEFMEFAKERGMVGIKGHRSVGGFRASIYNACPKESVEALVACMKEFEELHK